MKEIPKIFKLKGNLDIRGIYKTIIFIRFKE